MRGARIRVALELVRAHGALLRAAFDVRWVATGALVRTQAGGSAAPGPPGGEERAAAVRLARVVARAADQLPWRAGCLVRALALHRRLEASGLRGSVLRIGVRSGARGLVAHAWVMYGGAALEDGQATSFTRLTDVRAAGRS